MLLILPLTSVLKCSVTRQTFTALSVTIQPSVTGAPDSDLFYIQYLLEQERHQLAFQITIDLLIGGISVYYWFMLFLAIITEVASTSFMKMASGSNPMMGYTLMAVLISFSYFFLSQAVRKIPLAIAYTMWEGFGLLMISLMSWYFFNEAFSDTKLMAMAALMTGMVLMNLGEKLAEKKQQALNEEMTSCPITCN